MKNLPGSDGDGTGSASTVVGFDAWQIGGTYVKDRLKHAVTQKTVVIPAPDGVFVLQLNADGTEDQMGVLMDARRHRRADLRFSFRSSGMVGAPAQTHCR